MSNVSTDTINAWFATKSLRNLLALLPLPNQRRLRLLACTLCRINDTKYSGELYDIVEEWIEGVLSRQEAIDTAYQEYQANYSNHIIFSAVISIHTVEAMTQGNEQLSCALIHDIFDGDFYNLKLTREYKECKECEGTGLLATSNWVCLNCNGSGRVFSTCSWFTPSVVALAQEAYTQRDGYYLDYNRLLVLSDALEEAGCCDVPCPHCVNYEHNFPTGLVYCGNCGQYAGTGKVTNPLLTHLRQPKHYLCDNSGKHDHAGRVGRTIHGVIHETNPKVLHHHHDQKCKYRSSHVRGCWVVDMILGKNI